MYERKIITSNAHRHGPRHSRVQVLIHHLAQWSRTSKRIESNDIASRGQSHPHTLLVPD